MAVAAICIIAAPFALNSSKDDIPSAPAASDSALSDIDSISDSSEDSSAVVTTTPSVTTTAKNSSKTTTTAKAEETSAAEPTDPSGGQQPSGGGQSGGGQSGGQSGGGQSGGQSGGGQSGGQSGGGQSIGGIQLPQVAALPAPTFASGTPAAIHGQLSVSGANIVDKSGQIYQIRGMSTHGIMWEDFSNILSKDSLRVLRDDWGCNTIRIAMYTEGYAGYTTGTDFARQAKEKVDTGVANATDLGMYVIIDWHILSDNNPQNHQNEAITFFAEMSQKYTNYSNVLYEICNEPNGGTNWDGNVKPYADAVIPTIRQFDSDAIIICGTPTWSQDIDKAANNRVADNNTVYALHFYANTHTDWLRSRVQSCYNSGLPILVSEFGTCDASGNGGFNAGETQKWFDLLDSLNIGYLNWSACGKAETASAFAGGTNLAAIQAGTSQLTESGRIVREHLRQRAGLQ